MARDRKAAAAGASGQAVPSFEEAIERLQVIVEELEGGALSLEDSIARYEEGVRLSRRLTQTLDEAEKRIERLSEDASGAPVTEPMELEGAAEEPRPQPAPDADEPATGPDQPPDRSMGELPF
jgi:exodeoxyribonuclease VII small subunit